MFEKLKSLVSKSYMWILMYLASFICLDTFILTPFIKNHYFDTDLSNFKTEAWKYTFIIIGVTAVLLAIFSKAKQLSHIIYVVIISTILISGIKPLLTKIFLFINVKTETSQESYTYKIINHKVSQTFWLDSGEKKSIHDDEIKLIDKKRKEKGLPSILGYKNNDTIKVIYKKGIFNVNYLD